ncbi:endo-1,4-beta-xylanase [Streptomyces cinerochromogenes]|uniref:endo-1,4-beta-xylanase n=1 Tax=Streptomyces cinerochromogenes TaxID=66422 RepID=UPI0016710281|nr:endo-1,4-beta-xylanase [Streptomyces cinerochromogenes]GGS83177.1 beta-xylanase [Streptomyces cinerochromogenes]
MNLPRLLATACCLALLPLAVASPSHASGGPAAPDRPLRQLAADDHLRIGTAVDVSALTDDTDYRRLTGSEFSTVTPENVMKWESLEPRQGEYDWAAADRLVDFAHRHGQKVRGHVLVWHNQLPSWLTAGDLDAGRLRAALHRHITDTVRHFKGRIWQWDVVNEAFNEDGTLRDSIWLRTLGPGYIADAFRWAHEADPHALLFYNDYNTEWTGPKSDAVYDLLRSLRAAGVPVDGVGFQGHLSIRYDLPTGMADNFARFDRLGLATAVTEADVRMPVPADSGRLATQAEGYRRLLDACLRTRRCISFTVWGFTDRYSWVPDTFPGEGAANLFDEDYRPKPAYRALQSELAGRARSEAAG